MTIRVDEAIWPWRGRKWAHLVSDESHDELHDFAVELGIRRVSFQGDHYDVDESTRRVAIEAGAVETDPRDLVRALRAAGLRRAPRERIERWDAPVWREIVTDRRSLDRALLAADRHPTPMLDVVRAMSSSGPIDLSVLHRSREVAVVVADPHERPDWRTELDRALDVAPLTADVSVWIAGAGPSVVELLGAPS